MKKIELDKELQDLIENFGVSTAMQMRALNMLERMAIALEDLNETFKGSCEEKKS